MNCYDLVRKMRNIREWYTLTINEQALYYELVFVCNEKRWVEYFPCFEQMAGQCFEYIGAVAYKATQATVGMWID
ncbi:MAG: hypothetical protein LIO97_04465 [Tannerellaceae bacterium]|nr:hypothetical protein [Tannerellaceae bacterium]